MSRCGQCGRGVMYMQQGFCLSTAMAFGVDSVDKCSPFLVISHCLTALSWFPDIGWRGSDIVCYNRKKLTTYITMRHTMTIAAYGNSQTLHWSVPLSKTKEKSTMAKYEAKFPSRVETPVIGLRLALDVVERIKAEAEERGLSVSEVARQYLLKGMEAE